MKHLVDREIAVLSGGELQRFAIAAVAVQHSDVYMFDEPSSYLDVKQRLTAAHMIRQLLENEEVCIFFIFDLLTTNLSQTFNSFFSFCT